MLQKQAKLNFIWGLSLNFKPLSFETPTERKFLKLDTEVPEPNFTTIFTKRCT